MMTTEPSKPTFWLIDDDPIVFELVATRFQQFRFEFIQTRSQLQKKLVKPTTHCSGILLDFKLKYNLEGFDLIPLIERSLPNCPILLLTAYGTKEVVMRTMRSNIKYYHDKPINFAELESSLIDFAENDSWRELQTTSYHDHCHELNLLLEKPNTSIKTLKNLADERDLSYKYISRLYKEKHGISFSKNQIAATIKSAKNMLAETNLTVSEISTKLGYRNPSSFMRLFKSQTGFTASQFRAKHKHE